MYRYQASKSEYRDPGDGASPAHRGICPFTEILAEPLKSLLTDR